MNTPCKALTCIMGKNSLSNPLPSAEDYNYGAADTGIKRNLMIL